MMMDSVQQWLADLRWMTECECMSVLQSKSLTVHENNNVQTANTNGATSLHAKDQNNKKKQLIPKSVKEHIDVIRSRAHVVSSEFTKIFSKIEKDRWKHVTSRMLRIASHLRSLVHECDTAIPFNAPHVIWKQEEQLIENCNCLQNVATELMEINSTLPKKTPLLDQLTITGQIFGCLVDNVLGYLVQTIVDPIVCQSSAVAVKSSIIHLTDLAIDGEHMCFIVAREGGVRALLNICHNESIMTSWSHALRTLATVCCVPEAISELEKENGVELLTDLLNDSTLNETIRSEAAGVIAQITSPGLEQYQHLSGFLENIDDLVRSLTVLCVEASTTEVFLLGSAAVANITFMDSLSCDYLLQYHTARVLIEASLLNKAESIFSKDQVVTVLTNMAAMESCCHDITENNGIELLLHFLQERPHKYEADTEKSACERVQQKSAIALTRLSRLQENAQIIIACQGITRLVQLCRDSYERHNSDAVLVACLAALRKISASCGTKDFNPVDVQQLIRPKLLDSFLICSRLEESYV